MVVVDVASLLAEAWGTDFQLLAAETACIADRPCGGVGRVGCNEAACQHFHEACLLAALESARGC